MSEPFPWHLSQSGDASHQIRGRPLFFFLVVLSVILLVALIFLYARWITRFLPPSLSAPSPPVATPGLDADRLPIELFHRNPSESCETECCICLGNFEDDDKVRVLPSCRHRFHSDCLGRWLAAHSSCPLCRSSLRFNSAV
ncbi:hypothetical protein M569_03226 [Genlisea aurea]|uniref:RING-type E3 ubiquitin transferase n=1 Tax=Genlisea aurea TaxID=192259 RepID=S8EFV7_9LAMI|nr:hypothetical protein M569_03226 [Genlisea aurea]